MAANRKNGLQNRMISGAWPAVVGGGWWVVGGGWWVVEKAANR